MQQQHSGAYCASKKIYRKQETLLKHMKSNACSWVPEAKNQGLTSIDSSSNPCIESQTKKKANSALGFRTPGSCAVNKPLKAIVDPQLPSSDSPIEEPYTVRGRCTVPQSSRHLAAAQTTVVAEGSFARHLRSRAEVEAGSSCTQDPAPAQSDATRMTGCSNLLISHDVGGASRGSPHQPGSPHSSGVSTCLEELSLEQLLARLSNKDIQTLMQTTLPTSSPAVPSAPNQQSSLIELGKDACAETDTLEGPVSSSVSRAPEKRQASHLEPFSCCGESQRRLSKCQPNRERHASRKVSEKMKQGEQSSRPVRPRRIAPNKEGSAYECPQQELAKENPTTSTATRASKSRPASRSRAVQTKLRMDHRESEPSKIWAF